MGEQSASEESEPARILIADDHPLMRLALRGILEQQVGLEVVGEAETGREAIEHCRCLHPEVVLMDVRMPEMDGLAATRVIKRELPDTAVLIITAFENPSYLAEALKAGAAGYVLKHVDGRHITDAIRKVLAGQSPLNHSTTTQLLRRLLDGRGEATRSFEEELTPREVEVLQLLARGQTNQDIARSLLISVSTVKKHVHRILSKLVVCDRVQAAVKAFELGLLGDQHDG